MNAVELAAHLDPLDRELRQLAHAERQGLVRFLSTLDAFDREMGWALTKSSLWDYLVQELRLCESTAGRRLQAMKLLRRFPRLEEPIADGRLTLTKLCELSKVLADENLDTLVGKAGSLSLRQTQELVVSIQPRRMPAEGIRRLPAPVQTLNAPVAAPTPAPTSAARPEVEPEQAPAPALALVSTEPPPRPDRFEPISKGQWSVRITLDEEGKAALEEWLALLSHKNPRGNLSAAIQEAIRCGIEAHGKRRGTVRPERTRNAPEPIPRPRGERDPTHRDVRRQVMERDGYRCTFVGPDGKRCECRRQLELHHRKGALVSGSRPEDLEVRCRPHNVLDSVLTFGRAHVEQAIARRRASRKGISTPSAGSAPSVKSTGGASGPSTGG